MRRLYTLEERPACVRIDWGTAPRIKLQTMTHAWLKGSFEGSVKGWVIDQKNTNAIAKGGIAHKRDHIEYEFVYDHSCMSVLGQIMAARNFEYEWIFTHPKVLYSSFLESYLPRLSSRFLCCKLHSDMSGFGSKPLSFVKCELDDGPCRLCESKDPDILIPRILGFDSFYATSRKDYFSAESGADQGPGYEFTRLGHWFWRCSDNDLKALFKEVYLENHVLADSEGTSLSSDEIEGYFSRYFSRRHQKPLWKSQGEFSAIFNPLEFDPEDLEALQSRLATAPKSGSVTYSIPTGEIRKIFDLHGVRKPVVVKAAKKTKRLDPAQMYIYASGFGVLPLDEMGIKGFGELSTDSFFYVYGDIAQDAAHTVEELRKLFHEVADAIKAQEALSASEDASPDENDG